MRFLERYAFFILVLVCYAAVKLNGCGCHVHSPGVECGHE